MGTGEQLSNFQRKRTDQSCVHRSNVDLMRLLDLNGLGQLVGVSEAQIPHENIVFQREVELAPVKEVSFERGRV